MDVDRNQAEQRTLYGAPLGEILPAYAEALGVSRGRLAELLGLSPPMLSQLVNARRVRIGNPAAVRRLQAMHEIVADVQSGELEPSRAVEMLQGVREAGDVFTRTTTSRPHELARTLRAVLHAAAPPEAFERAARVLDVDHPIVGEALRSLAGPDEQAAIEWIARQRTGAAAGATPG